MAWSHDETCLESTYESLRWVLVRRAIRSATSTRGTWLASLVAGLLSCFSAQGVRRKHPDRRSNAATAIRRLIVKMIFPKARRQVPGAGDVPQESEVKDFVTGTALIPSALPRPHGCESKLDLVTQQ